MCGHLDSITNSGILVLIPYPFPAPPTPTTLVDKSSITLATCCEALTHWKRL